MPAAAHLVALATLLGAVAAGMEAGGGVIPIPGVVCSPSRLDRDSPYKLKWNWNWSWMCILHVDEK
jgi:hypothetical protein